MHCLVGCSHSQFPGWTGLYAERHELARCGGRRCCDHGLHKSAAITKAMIGRQHQHQRVRIVFRQDDRCSRNGWRGVACYRLQHDGAKLAADLLSLLGDDKAMGLVADNHGMTAIGTGLSHSQCFLQHGLLPHQRQKLFRIQLAR